MVGLGFQRYIRRRRNPVGYRGAKLRPHIKHVPFIPVLHQPGRRGRPGIGLPFGAQRQLQSVFFPMAQVFAGRQAGEPSRFTGSVVVQVIGSVILDDHRFAGSVCIATVRSRRTGHYQPFVLDLHAQHGLRPAVHITRCDPGVFLSRQVPRPQKQAPYENLSHRLIFRVTSSGNNLPGNQIIGRRTSLTRLRTVPKL